MQYLDMQNIKTIFFVFFGVVIGSFKANAGLPLPMVNAESSCLLTETREFLLTSDNIMLIGFILWVLYIVFCFPKNTLKKL